MSPTRYGIALPQVFVEEPLRPADLVTFAREAEDLGYEGLWTQDQVLGSARTLEATGLLCYVAAVTERVRLGVSVLVLPYRAPVPLAKTLGTLDNLSGGRLDVGVGVGNPSPLEAAFGVGPGQRLRRFREGVATLKALWADGTASRESDLWPLAGAAMEPKPLQRPHPRLWFGARHPNAIRRAVAEADGWMGAGSSTRAQFVEQLALVRESLAATDRDPGSFRIAKRVYLAIDDDAGRAERRLREWFGAYYGNADLASQVCVWGPADKVADEVRAVVEAGAEMVLLNPVFDYPRHAEILAERLGMST